MKISFVVALLLSIACNSHAQVQWNQGTPSSTIYYNGGNVGIGVSSPGASLHIQKSRASFFLQNTNVNDWSFLRIQGSGTNLWDIGQYGNNDYLEFRPNGNDQNRVVIKQSGYVGIGTASPNHKLEVADVNGIPSLGIKGNLDAKIVFEPSDGSDRFTIWSDMDHDTYNDLLRFGAVNAPDVLSLKGNGNVGIGSVNPQSKLHIKASNNDGILIGAYNDQLNWNGTGSQPGYHIRFAGFRDVVQNFTGARISALRTNSCCNGLAQGMELAFYVTGGVTQNGDGNLIESVRLATSGNVGIGTTNPTQKLTVKGTVYSTEVKVDVNAGTGPDYVFEPSYNLPTLAETEAYIKANKHLPEVPSAKEMEANGINLSEMNMLLLKKVEELTLHLIELKKHVESQDKVIQQLGNKN